MFNFFDSDKNPFMVMMNHIAASSAGTEENKTADAGDMDPMQFMEQAMKMQAQMAQSMFLMPFAMMQGIADAMGFKPGEAGEAGHGGFKLGNIEIPPELLQMVLQMDMKPENLEKLQKVLDFVFSAMPEPKSDDE